MSRRAQPWYRASMDAWYTTIDGKQVQLARGEANKEEAYRVFHELMARPKPERSRHSEMAFAALADHYLDFLERDRETSTYTTARRHLASFLDHIGRNMAAIDLRPHHVTAWAESHAWGPTMQNSAMTAVKCVTSWGVKQGYLERNPIEFLKKPTPRKRDKVLTTEQYRAVLAEAEDEQLRDLLEALHKTGARPGEIRRLEARMINWETGVVTMKGKTTRVTGKMRRIQLTGELLATCKRLATVWPEGPIFRNAKGRPWTSAAISGRLRRIRARLGYGGEVAAICFRHLFATDAMEAEVPLETIAKLMGHENANMTFGTYSHLGERTEYLRSVVERLSEARNGTPEPPSGNA